MPDKIRSCLTVTLRITKLPQLAATYSAHHNEYDSPDYLADPNCKGLHARTADVSKLKIYA